jgi:hypothetical protein
VVSTPSPFTGQQVDEKRTVIINPDFADEAHIRPQPGQRNRHVSRGATRRGLECGGRAERHTFFGKNIDECFAKYDNLRHE